MRWGWMTWKQSFELNNDNEKHKTIQKVFTTFKEKVIPPLLLLSSALLPTQTSCPPFPMPHLHSFSTIPIKVIQIEIQLAMHNTFWTYIINPF